jgi:hypothetical protein
MSRRTRYIADRVAEGRATNILREASTARLTRRWTHDGAQPVNGDGPHVARSLGRWSRFVPVRRPIPCEG